MEPEIRKQTRKARKWILGLILLIPGPGMLWAQPAPIPHHREPYLIDSGLHVGTVDEAAAVFGEFVHVSGVPWLRIHFGDYNLGHSSYLTLTSLQDGGQQRLNAISLPQWQNASAFFNGDTVHVVLHVAPDDEGVFFRIEEVTVGEWGAPGTQSQCGDNDDRIASNDAAVGRIMPAGCTGWIVSNGAHLTAGHCVGTSMSTLQFNIPTSTCDGTTVNPPPEDQYAIDSLVNFADGGLGNDWAVFACFPDSNTGLLPVEAQQEFFRMTRDAIVGGNVRVTGHGLDDDPTGCTGFWNATSQTQQTHSGDWINEYVQGNSVVVIDYIVDTEGGNSGSPVQLGAFPRVTIGIHTNGGCAPPDFGNSGTGFEHDNLELFIQNFPGLFVTYVDSWRYSALADGTVFRPFDRVATGIGAVTPGGAVCIVAGTYNEPMTINKAMTLHAPVGAVTIQ